MAVAKAVPDQESPCVTTGGHGALSKINQMIGGVRQHAFDSDFPCPASRWRAGNSEISAKIDKPRCAFRAPHHGNTTIDGVFLADAAKVDLHARGKDKVWPLPPDTGPAYPGKHRLD